MHVRLDQRASESQLAGALHLLFLYLSGSSYPHCATGEMAVQEWKTGCSFPLQEWQPSPAPTEELDGSGSESEELFSDKEEGSSSPLIPFSVPVRSRATGPTGPRKSSSAPCRGDSSTTAIVDDSHQSRHRKSLKVTCLGGLLRIFTTVTSPSK